MNNTLHMYNQDKVQVAAHRGVAGANIPCNTIQAFEIALRSGAAILEMDLCKSSDGEIFIFHTGKELAHLGRDIDLERMNAAEINELRLVNMDFNETQYGINHFDEVLEQFKGRCILNLDRCGGFFPEVVKMVERHKMSEQILLKNRPDKEVLRIVEEVCRGYMFMPILTDEDTASEAIERMEINFVGVELSFASEESPIIQPEYIDKMLKKGKALWCNGLIYDYKVHLAAGHSDDLSMSGNPDDGWGWLVDKGFTIIQTDWTAQCCQYLKDRGIN